MSLHHLPRFRPSHHIQMIFLCAALGTALANPVSSPEIATSKSGKSAASAIVGNANSLQQQQQKSSPQDAHLNSLTVYATNFDSITSGNPQQPSRNFKPSYSFNTNSNGANNNYNSNDNNNYNSNGNNNYNSNSNNNFNSNSNYNSNSNSNSISNNNFNNQNHNSYLSLPEIETNFTPMQQSTIQTSDLAQPVIMQYLPQTVQASDGIQYLQLIPTRPLMVPISSYMPGTSAGQIAPDVTTTVSNNIGYHHNNHPPTLTAGNTIAEYASRTPSILGPQLPANAPAPAPSVLMNIPATHTFGLQNYSPQILHPYRNFRINRETKPKHLPPGLSLNMHEYLPSPHDPPRSSFVRGRP